MHTAGQPRYSLERVQPGMPEARQPRGRAVWLGPIVIAHFVAYPVAFFSAVAAMPYAMLLRKRALLAAGNEGASIGLIRDAARGLSLTRVEAAQLQVVLVFSLSASLVVLLLVHLAALPWAVARARARDDAPATLRARRSFMISIAVLVSSVGAAGLAGWIWLATL